MSYIYGRTYLFEMMQQAFDGCPENEQAILYAVHANVIIMRPFFAFRQKSRFLAGRTSVGCQKLKLKSFFCTRDVCLCVIQHLNWPLTSTILNAHGTNASPDGLCTRTHTNEAFSCWFSCNSFTVDQARRGNVCFFKPSHALLPISLSGNLKMVWVLI